MMPKLLSSVLSVGDKDSIFKWCDSNLGYKDVVIALVDGAAFD